MSAVASEITGVLIVYSAVCTGADKKKSKRIHRWLVHSPHKVPVKRKKFPFHDFIMAIIRNDLGYLPWYQGTSILMTVHQ